MSIVISSNGPVDNRPVYLEGDIRQLGTDELFNVLFEDGEGKFILFPNGYMDGSFINHYLVFKPNDQYNTSRMMLVAQQQTSPEPIIWPLRPALKSVIITISGDYQ